MIDRTQVESLYDCDVIDNKGERIGSVKRVWLEDGTGTPAWAEVHTGLFGLKESFVPLQQSLVRDGSERGRRRRAHVAAAAGGALPALRDDPAGQDRRARPDGPRRPGRHALRGELEVGARDVETGRVRLVKHVVTEERDVTVRVSHEEVRVVREPVEGGAAEAFADEQAEMTLHREEPVVRKRAATKRGW